MKTTLKLLLLNQAANFILFGLVFATLAWAGGLPGFARTWVRDAALSCTMDRSTGLLACPSIGIYCDGGAANDCFVTMKDNTGDPDAPAPGSTILYFKGGELYKRDNGDGAGVGPIQ